MYGAPVGPAVIMGPTLEISVVRNAPIGPGAVVWVKLGPNDPALLRVTQLTVSSRLPHAGTSAKSKRAVRVCCSVRVAKISDDTMKSSPSLYGSPAK